jgi:hypothetical protein
LFILNALENRPLPVYGDGAHIRDWIHIYDHVAAIINLLHQESASVEGAIFNIGASEERTILQNAYTVLDLLGKPYSLIHFVGDRQGHVRRHAIDASKIRLLCNWHPHISFSEGIQSTIAWYQENREWIADVQTRNNAFLQKALHLAETEMSLPISPFACRSAFLNGELENVISTILPDTSSQKDRERRSLWLERTERLNGIELGRTHGRIVAKDDTHTG